MFLLFGIIGYLLGSIPGIAFFSDKIDNLNKKTFVVPKKGITISYYPAFNWQWLFLGIDVLKFGMFYFVLENGSFSLVLGIILGHGFPLWKPTLQRSVLLFLLIFVFQINVYLFLLLLVAEIVLMFFLKKFIGLPSLLIAFVLSIFYWVSGADIYFVLVSLLLFVLLLISFLKNYLVSDISI